jgi:hypothetical protein
MTLQDSTWRQLTLVINVSVSNYWSVKSQLAHQPISHHFPIIDHMQLLELATCHTLDHRLLIGYELANCALLMLAKSRYCQDKYLDVFRWVSNLLARLNLVSGS